MTSLNKSALVRLTKDRVDAAMSKFENPKVPSFVFGSVKAVNTDGSYSVRLNKSSVPTRCTACDTASVGDRVAVVINTDGKSHVVGRVGGVVSAAELDELEELLGISSGGGCSMTDLMWDMAHPVGSVLQVANGFDPNTVRGTWERVEGRFLLASGGGYERGDTGGEATHTLTENEMAKVSGYINLRGWTWGSGTEGNIALSVGGAFSGTSRSSSYDLLKYGDAQGGYEEIKFTAGGDKPHNNMPPYLAVDTWRRVA